MTKPFRENQYRASLEACKEYGVPDDLAEKVSRIVASDEADKPDFGRTPLDQEIVKQVVPYFQKGGSAS